MREFWNIVLIRRLRLAAVAGYIAFGDKITKIATILPDMRRRRWEERIRPRLLSRAQLLESRIG
jgi:hypothetical protein